ncbi:MFS transporter [Streptomyces sp. NPDC054956]
MSLSRWLSTRFFFFFMAWSVFLSYWGLWLTHAGFTPSQISLSMSAGLLARAASVSFLFPALCRTFPVLELARFLPWFSAGLSLLYLIPPTLSSVLAASVLIGVFFPMLMPLNDTVATFGSSKGLISYGNVRYWGSAGFIAGLAVTGAATSRYGAGIVVVVYVGSCAVMAATGTRGPRTETAFPAVPAERSWRTLLRNRVFVLSLALSFLLQGAHAVYYSFGAERFRSTGLSGIGVGLLLASATVAELLLFKYLAHRLEALSVPVLFAIAAAASVVRWAASAADPPLAVVILLQVLHAGSFALTHFSFVKTVRTFVPEAEWASAHGIHAAVAMSLGGAFVTALAGPLYGISPAAAFLGMAAVCLPCAPLLFALSSAVRAAAGTAATAGKTPSHEETRKELDPR